MASGARSADPGFSRHVNWAFSRGHVGGYGERRRRPGVISTPGGSGEEYVVKTKAAVLVDAGKPFEIMELDLDGPREGEVLIRYTAAGLCHSDLHLTDGDLVPRFPIVGGHEGAGIIEEVGPGVTKVKPGDHVVCSFIPNCGTCRYCSTGRQNLCDMGATILEGYFPDGSFRFHAGGEDFGAMCLVGTFSQYSTISQHSVVKVDDWLPLEKAVLVGCGVPTGWGSAVYAGNVRAGDTCVVYGIGGIGINAVQGAAHAGAKHVIVVDPVELKRDTALRLGATHAFATAEQAQAKIEELTWGQGADQALITVGTVDEDVVSAAFNAVGKGGTVVVTGLANPEKLTIHLSGSVLTLFEKTVKGTLFGSSNPQYDIVRLLRLYDAGQLKLDELVTRTYTLDQVNEGYQDLRDGRNIRGVLLHET
jgi:S-(hydroxymethyl)glutathione dehydrogenase/alcohol dehydrogenase